MCGGGVGEGDRVHFFNPYWRAIAFERKSILRVKTLEVYPGSPFSFSNRLKIKVIAAVVEIEGPTWGQRRVGRFSLDPWRKSADPLTKTGQRGEESVRGVSPCHGGGSGGLFRNCLEFQVFLTSSRPTNYLPWSPREVGGVFQMIKN